MIDVSVFVYEHKTKRFRASYSKHPSFSSLICNSCWQSACRRGVDVTEAGLVGCRWSEKHVSTATKSAAMECASALAALWEVEGRQRWCDNVDVGP